MTITIEKVTEKDLKILQETCIETFTDTFGKHNTEENLQAYLQRAYCEDQLKRELSREGSSFFFILVDNEVGGFLKVNVGEAQSESMGEDGLEIERIYILPKFKRQGLGMKLVNYAIESAKLANKKLIWLGVWESNVAAQALYARVGFQQVGKHTFYLGDDPQTDYIMAKQL
eukprot:Gregarina_sp_Poly_1__6500@NODE_3483_length_1063_cov_27_349398_g2209_i0_p1_GENE_NODE_3483_length_1063_cov_27_349398_g2209_i0NODE_3483_length_1063_cov_27_349398_g2209_i0_p1_ORF_typecomplete_len172_score30_01Acetyltransf_1/PF00583_25/8_9e18Acetyltransf_10/PF13673_7/8_6e17Acetyltransf_7/PF13508_7/4_9e11GNAT_acetyltran/PF12746_7/1e10Acetyltransf_4/PF13420_7/1_4e10FR47/PF08445_10/6_9e03FR47/PF08445_10/4_1e10Acetyltransf_3/PF13302_7/1e08Acetyltransf_9/PF13527_7/2e05Acetyltransf_CG/PF14542_6/0_001Acetyl